MFLLTFLIWKQINLRKKLHLLNSTIYFGRKFRQLFNWQNFLQSVLFSIFKIRNTAITSFPRLGMFLRCSYFFAQFQPKCSYKLGSYKKKRVWRQKLIRLYNFLRKTMNIFILIQVKCIQYPEISKTCQQDIECKLFFLRNLLCLRKLLNYA